MNKNWFSKKTVLLLVTALVYVGVILKINNVYQNFYGEEKVFESNVEHAIARITLDSEEVQIQKLKELAINSAKRDPEIFYVRLLTFLAMFLVTIIFGQFLFMVISRKKINN